MFAEPDTVTLTDPIPLKNTWDIPEGSPLRQAVKPGEGLLPGDVGVIVSIYAAAAEPLRWNFWNRIAMVDRSPSPPSIPTKCARLMSRTWATIGSGKRPWSSVVPTHQIP